MVIEWACAERALGNAADGAESGDLHAVAPFPRGVLVAVIDGLGHGREAAVAARGAAEVLQAHAGEGLDILVRRCHADLRRTRGVVMSLASFDVQVGSMTWTGVGNVEAVLIREQATARLRHEALCLRGGVVGYTVPKLRPETVAVSPGDTLIMVTDGIRSNFTDGIDLRDSPQNIADSILAHHLRHSDDALAFVARYIGEPLPRGVAQATSDGERHDPVTSIEGVDWPHRAIQIREDVDVVIARTTVRDLALQNGLLAAAAEALATATSELGRNILQHATVGEILLATLCESDRRGVLVVARDQGPGLHNIKLAMQDGYSSTDGLGLGLSSARRLVDDFDLITAPGKGTTVVLKKWTSRYRGV